MTYIEMEYLVMMIMNRIVKALAEQDNTNEQLKETNQLLWVGLMNNYKLSAEETVYNEIIFP